MSDLFAGFQAFAAPAAPEGFLTLQYGLSVQVVQIELVGSVRTEPGVTPAALAAQYATKFNMPASGLLAYADGKPVDLGTPIPATTRTLEFRQPASEKGGAMPQFMIPLEPGDAIVIRVLRQDTVDYTSTVEQVLGRLTPPELAQALQFKPGVVVLRVEGEFAIIGRRDTVTKATRTAFTLVADLKRRVQGGVAPTRHLSINTVRGEWGNALQTRLNGEDCDNGFCRDLEAGDVLELVIAGETRTGDFSAWAAEMRQEAHIAYEMAQGTRTRRYAERQYKLGELGWFQLVAEAKKLGGIKLVGKGRTADALRRDILAKEFPKLPSEEKFVSAWLGENAPEVLEG